MKTKTIPGNGNRITNLEVMDETAIEAPPMMVKQAKGRGKEASTIPLCRPRRATIRVDIVGVRPLLMHNFGSGERLGGLEDFNPDGTPKAKKKKGPRNPQGAFEEAKYQDAEKKRYGIPCGAFKTAICNAASGFSGLSKSGIKTMFFIQSDFVDPRSNMECVAITCSKPHLVTHIVRVGKWPTKQPDLRYRPQFDEWKCTLRIEYDALKLNPTQIVALVDQAGWEGVLDGRPSSPMVCSQDYGRFKVATQD